MCATSELAYFDITSPKLANKTSLSCNEDNIFELHVGILYM